MNEHRKKPQEKTKLPVNWLESDAFEMKLPVRSGPELLPPSDTAFVLKSKLPTRQSRIPGT